MSKSRITEIIIATVIGAMVTILSKIAEAYITQHLSIISNVSGGVAAGITYLAERAKYI